MKSIWRWVRAVAFRIKVAGAAWLMTIFSGLALYWAFTVPLPQDAEQRLRVIGTVLQVASIVTVGVGIRRVRKRLDKPDICRQIVRYFTTLFAYPKDYRLDAGTGSYGITLEGASLSATGTAAPAVTQPPTAEERFAKLDSAVGELSGKLDLLHAKIAEESVARERALNEERSARTEQQREQRRLIDELHAGDALVTVVGFIWLLLGIVLAGTSDILAGFAAGAS